MIRDTGGCRRFTLGDAMVLIAALAVGFVASWRLLDLGSWDLQTVASWKTDQAVWAVVAGTMPTAAALTAAVPVVRLRRPRPRLRRLFRQPGFVACLSALLFAAAAHLAVPAAFLRPHRLWSHIYSYPLKGFEALLLVKFIPLAVGYVVLASWGQLALGGRWRPEAGWIDRAGVALGVYWVATSLAYVYMFV